MGAAEPAVKLPMEPEVLNSLNSGVAVVSRDQQRLLYCNATFARWLELPPGACIGRTVTELDAVLKAHFFPAAAAQLCLRHNAAETEASTRELGLRTGGH